MRSWTKTELETSVQSELGLEALDIVTAADFTSFTNKAIDDAEAIIHKINEDYFLTSSSLAMVASATDIALPSTIYATKIRGLVFQNADTIYEVKRIRNMRKFMELATRAIDATDADYKYLIVNDSAAAGVKLRLSPPARETHASRLTLWYLRNAARLTSGSDVCDIPEFANYLLAHIARSCQTKINGGFTPPDADKAVQTQEVLMTNTLSEMIVDNDNEAEADLGHYEDHV